jgi:hypothetical protein
MPNRASMEAPSDDWLAGRAARLPAPLTHLLLRPGEAANLPALLSRIERLESEKAELQLLLEGATTSSTGYVLFLETADGYRVVESAELPPPVDQLLFVDGRSYSIEAARRSPFPHDARPCFVCRPS